MSLVTHQKHSLRVSDKSQQITAEWLTWPNVSRTGGKLEALDAKLDTDSWSKPGVLCNVHYLLLLLLLYSCWYPLRCRAGFYAKPIKFIRKLFYIGQLLSAKLPPQCCVIYPILSLSSGFSSGGSFSFLLRSWITCSSDVNDYRSYLSCLASREGLRPELASAYPDAVSIRNNFSVPNFCNLLSSTMADKFDEATQVSIPALVWFNFCLTVLHRKNWQRSLSRNKLKHGSIHPFTNSRVCAGTST